MAGPYPPYPPVGAEGQPPGRPPYELYAYPGQVPNPYPGPLPPPVNYSAQPQPKDPRRMLWLAAAALTAVIALVAAAVLLAGGRMAPGTGEFTDAASKTAIQDYLNALSDNDTDAIARNAACGMFDAIKDRKSDLALARLAGDAFRKQFSSAEVTSIDQIVLSSSYQAQVLFTMRVVPASGGRDPRDDQQGVAQLLRQGNELLVCSYLLRTAAQY